jgi:hypothetical protein
MYNKKYITELRKYTLDKIIELSEFYGNNNILETSYSNWNVRDVIAHINCWVKFFGDKLESFKTRQIFEDVAHNGIEKLNRLYYEKNINKSLDDVVNESKIIFDNYKNVLDLYTESELLSKEYQTGFPCTLWEYMVLDLFIHPINHILYQYIKTKDYDKFINTIDDSKKCSNNNIGIYNFSNLFEQKEEKYKYLNKLLDKIENTNNKFVEEIIRINMSKKYHHTTEI